MQSVHKQPIKEHPFIHYLDIDSYLFYAKVYLPKPPDSK